jgi:hypothetical protein
MLRPGNDGVRKLIACIGLTLVAASCRDATVSSTPQSQGPVLQIHESPSPFTEVTAGPVRALIPANWHPRLARSPGGLQEGVIASPHLREWVRGKTPVRGMAALWVDGTEVGVPSDYYLAATGPALDLLTRSADCTTTRNAVAVDHRPTFFSGPPDSPGDYVARGHGICEAVGDGPTRWAYFVAAPGFGPVRGFGIPTSGLYVVIAMIGDSPRARRLLNKLMNGAEFGGASVQDLYAAART